MYEFNWSIRFKIIKIVVGTPLASLALTGIIGKIGPYNLPHFLSFNLPLTIGIIITWILLAFGITLALNSFEELESLIAVQRDKKKSVQELKLSFDVIFIFTTLVIAFSLFTFFIDNSNEVESPETINTSSEAIFLTILMQGFGLLFGLFFASLLIYGAFYNKEEEHLITIQKKDNNSKMKNSDNEDVFKWQTTIFNPFGLGRSNFPLEVFLGAISGAIYGFFLTLLLYPFPGNFYTNYLPQNFLKSSDPLILLFFIPIILVILIYPRFNILAVTGICLGWLGMGLCALHLWTINNLSIDAGNTLNSNITQIISLAFLLTATLWGAIRGYQIWKNGRNKY